MSDTPTPSFQEQLGSLMLQLRLIATVTSDQTVLVPEFIKYEDAICDLFAQTVTAVMPEKMTFESAGARYDIDRGIVAGYNQAISTYHAALLQAVRGEK
jgi:hypothetical protein